MGCIASGTQAVASNIIMEGSDGHNVSVLCWEQYPTMPVMVFWKRFAGSSVSLYSPYTITIKRTTDPALVSGIANLVPATLLLGSTVSPE